MSSTTRILFATSVPGRTFPAAHLFLGLYAARKALTILRDRNSPAVEPEALALGALGWIVSDDDRAERLLALTGLTGDTLRRSLGSRAVLAAVLEFLCGHEPDLVAAAEHLGVTPQVLADASRELSA